MKKLDLYIIKKFLGTFFFAITLIIVIVIIFDISEKIDDFLNKNAPVSKIIIDYYLNFIPYFVNLFSALFTFIAVIFFTSKLASRTEIIAILSSGVSFRRLLVPYIVSASIIAIISLILSNYLIPPANKKRLAFEDAYFRYTIRNISKNYHMQVSPGVYVYVESFNTMSNSGLLFSLEKFEGSKQLYKLMADNIIWNQEKKSWKLQNYHLRTINGYKEQLYSGNEIDTILNFKPSDFLERVVLIETMNYHELKQYIAQEKHKGSENVPFYEVEQHKRLAFPFANIILTLIGVSLSSKKVRGGIGLHLGIGMGISFTYIMFMQVSVTFATYGNLSPILAVWIPNIVFGLLSIYLIKQAPK